MIVAKVVIDGDISLCSPGIESNGLDVQQAIRAFFLWISSGGERTRFHMRLKQALDE